MKKKRIAFITNTLANGGAERVVSNLSLFLSDLYDIDIVMNDTERIDYPYVGNIISLGLKPKQNKRNLFYQMVVFYVRVRKIRELKKKQEYIAVISFSDSANIANIISGKKNCKTILSVHTNITKQGRDLKYKYLASPLIRLLYNRASGVVAVSQGVATDLINYHGVNKEKITVIYNGCDIDGISNNMYKPLSNIEKEWVSGNNIITTVGRLDDSKGQWHLIRALSNLKRQGIQFKLLVIGQGELEEYLKTLAEQYNLKDDVLFLGFCDNPFKLMARSDLFVTSSIYEGFSNTLLEALACGVPCIATDFECGAREILAPDTYGTEKCIAEVEMAEYGILVPVCDGKYYTFSDPLTEEEKTLSSAIGMLLTDDKLQEKYRNIARKRAEELSLNITSEEWNRFIER